jgi:hypothetical protein
LQEKGYITFYELNGLISQTVEPEEIEKLARTFCGDHADTQLNASVLG